MDREDFTSLLAVQKALHDHSEKTHEVTQLLNKLEPLLGDIDTITSKHRANMSMVIVNHSQDPHKYLDMLPKRDHEENKFKTILQEPTNEFLTSIKNALDELQSSIKKNYTDSTT